MAAVEYTVFKGSKSGDIVEARGSRTPGPTEVAIKITHCGVCGTDEHYRHADMGLGHEGVGVITALGSAVPLVSDFKVGDRVLAGWCYKTCGHCASCLAGRNNLCAEVVQYGTANADQGLFGTAATWDVSTLSRVPDGIASEHAGPLICGGATVWDALYQHGARAGDRVGVMGIGGLGHLAIQFASKMGMEVVVYSSSEAKRQEAVDLGASEFYVTSDAERLKGADKVDVMLITSNQIPDVSVWMPLMAAGGHVIPLTISMENMNITPLGLIAGPSVSVVATSTAPNGSVRTMLRFAAKQGIKPMIEKFPMTQAGVTDAMQKLRDGKMRYRAVLIVE